MTISRLITVIVIFTLLRTWPALAAIQIKITGISEPLKDNVEAFLELKQYADEKTLSEATVRRLYKRAEKNIRDALRPFGYYEPRINTRLSQTEDGW